MVNHTQAIRWQHPTNRFSVSDHIAGLTIVRSVMERNCNTAEAYFETHSSIYDGDFCDNT